METIDSYLTNNEQVKLRWQGGLKSEGKSDSRQSITGTNGQTTFAATTKRLMLVNGDGGFKDIDNSHISSVEVEKSTDPDPTPVQWVAMIGLLFGAGGILGIFTGELGWGFLGLIVGGVAFGAAWVSVDDPSQLFEFPEKITYEVKLITGDESHQQIKFKTEENVGAELSRIVRENG